MEKGTGIDYKMPEYYLNINAVSLMCYADIIDTYNHYRKIAKRILKNKKDFDGLPYRDYKRAIECIYPPATKIRSREFLNKYMFRLALFLTMSRGEKYGYKEKV